MVCVLSTELLEVTIKEKEAGIYPEADVDVFMKVGCLCFM